MEIKISVKPLFDDNKNQIGCIANAMILSAINKQQKGIIENKLKELAYTQSKIPIQVYHEEYSDTASIIVLGDTNKLPNFQPFSITV